MLHIEKTVINGREFIHTYSDEFTIERDGIEYIEAYDPAGSGRKYCETGVVLSREGEPDADFN